MIDPDILEAAQQATLETHRLDVKAARTGNETDKTVAEIHYLNAETAALEAAFGKGHKVSTRGIRTVQPWHKQSEVEA